MLSQKLFFSLLFVLYLSAKINGSRVKRMYALCPPNFFRIGNECYFISKNRVNWLDAHFECKDRNSRLAEPFKQEDRFLRKYLNSLRSTHPSDIWIGGRYNWERNKWQWGYNGKDITYQSFSQMSGDRKDLKWHCAILKPELKYRWSASSCVESHQYICQHRMPYVSAKNRQRVYNKWNQTYPNEIANEVEVVLSEDDLLRHRQRMQRLHPRNRPNMRQTNTEQNRRRENDLPFNDLSRINSGREIRMGNNRQRNDIPRSDFNFKLNRKQAGGIRKPIQFNGTIDAAQRQRNREWKRKQRLNFATTTTVPPFIYSTRMTTTTQSPTTMDYWNQRLSQEKILLKQRNEEERLHLENEQRRIEQEQENLRRLEEQRIQEENRLREKHLREMQRRREEIEMEQKQMLEMERMREERRQKNLLINQQNEENRQKIEEAQRERQELLQKQLQQENAQQREIQTNEILETITTPSTIAPELTTVNAELKLQLKREKQRRLRERIRHLTPEQQEEYFRKKNLRAEKNRKRNTNVNVEQ